MIYCIEGVLDCSFQDSVVILAYGVGYEVLVPAPILSKLPPLNSNLRLYTYDYIREDSHQLFGFLDSRDRDLFITSLKVNGLGPKVALKIFSHLSGDDFVTAIISKNLVTLTSVPGIGKKMAEKLVLELKDPFLKMSPNISQDLSSVPSPSAIDPQLKQDLQVALKTLGYSYDEIKRAFSKCQQELTPSLSLEKGVKLLLQYL